MLKETDILLTTKDNPYNPFTQYDDWKYFDETTKHYNTEAYIARIVGLLDPDISEEELAHERVNAFKEIIRVNDEMGLDIYTLISREGEKLDSTPSSYLGEKDIEDTPGGGSENTPTP